jgi:hypothetical protein
MKKFLLSRKLYRFTTAGMVVTFSIYFIGALSGKVSIRELILCFAAMGFALIAYTYFDLYENERNKK